MALTVHLNLDSQDEPLNSSEPVKLQEINDNDKLEDKIINEFESKVFNENFIIDDDLKICQ